MNYVTFNFATKSVICEGTLEQCAKAMLAAEDADQNASVEVGHLVDGLLKSLSGGDLMRLRKLLSGGAK